VSSASLLKELNQVPKGKPLTACGLCPFNPSVLDYTKCVGAPTVSMSTAFEEVDITMSYSSHHWKS